MNGLDISEEEFKRMNAIDRDLIIYKNLSHIRNKYDKKFNNYAFHKKIQYVWLSLLTAFLGVRRIIGF